MSDRCRELAAAEHRSSGPTNWQASHRRLNQPRRGAGLSGAVCSPDPRRASVPVSLAVRHSFKTTAPTPPRREGSPPEVELERDLQVDRQATQRIEQARVFALLGHQRARRRVDVADRRHQQRTSDRPAAAPENAETTRAAPRRAGSCESSPPRGSSPRSRGTSRTSAGFRSSTPSATLLRKKLQTTRKCRSKSALPASRSPARHCSSSSKSCIEPRGYHSADHRIHASSGPSWRLPRRSTGGLPYRPLRSQRPANHA